MRSAGCEPVTTYKLTRTEFATWWRTDGFGFRTPLIGVAWYRSGRVVLQSAVRTAKPAMLSVVHRLITSAVCTSLHALQRKILFQHLSIMHNSCSW